MFSSLWWVLLHNSGSHDSSKPSCHVYLDEKVPGRCQASGPLGHSRNHVVHHARAEPICQAVIWHISLQLNGTPHLVILGSYGIRPNITSWLMASCRAMHTGPWRRGWESCSDLTCFLPACWLPGALCQLLNQRSWGTVCLSGLVLLLVPSGAALRGGSVTPCWWLWKHSDVKLDRSRETVVEYLFRSLCKAGGWVS